MYQRAVASIYVPSNLFCFLTSECPNYDALIPALLKYGVEDLPNHCKLTPGTSVLRHLLSHEVIYFVFPWFEVGLLDELSAISTCLACSRRPAKADVGAPDDGRPRRPQALH